MLTTVASAMVLPALRARSASLTIFWSSFMGAFSSEAVFLENRTGRWLSQRCEERACRGALAAGRESRRIDDRRMRRLGKGIDDAYPRFDSRIGAVDDPERRFATRYEEEGG